METGSITSINPFSVGDIASSEQGIIETKKNELGMDDFFKLLTTQLVSQDPLEPLQDTEFIAQMANFSSLAQMESIADNMAGVRSQQDSLAVMALMGRQVEADDGSGSMISGVVNRVEYFHCCISRKQNGIRRWV